MEATKYRALCRPSSQDHLQGANDVTYQRNQWAEHHGPHPQGLIQDHRPSQTHTKSLLDLLQELRPHQTSTKSLLDLLQDHRSSQTATHSFPGLVQDHHRPIQTHAKSLLDLLQEIRPHQTSTKSLLDLLQDRRRSLTPPDSFPCLMQDSRSRQTLDSSLSLIQDHHSSQTSMNALVGGAETSDRQDIGRHLHDTEAMEYGMGSSSILLSPSIIRSIENAILEWNTHTSRNEHSTYYGEPQFTIGHNDSDGNCPNSNGDSLNPDGDSLGSDGNTDTLFSPLYMVIDDMLSTPLTPTSIELTGPGGKPLRLVVETNAYFRGESSTGDLIESIFPGRLSPRPRYVPTMQEIADRFEAVLPTVFEEDQITDRMEGDGQEHAITGAIYASPTEQEYQDAEAWYLSAPSRPPPNKPLPPLPVTRSQGAVRSGPVRDKKPTPLEILPMSVYNNAYTVEQGESRFLPSPGPLPVQPAHLEPFSSSAQSHRDGLPRAVSPVYSESDIHPAFRSKSSPHGQEPILSARHFTNSIVSPSLPASRCPSVYLRPSPDSSPTPFMSTLVSPSLPASRCPSTYLRPSLDSSPRSSIATMHPSSRRSTPSNSWSSVFNPSSHGPTANTSPLLISFGLYQHLTSIGETEFANCFFTDRRYVLQSPFTDPRPAPPTPRVNEGPRASHRRAATTGALASQAFQDLPTRSSSLPTRQIHNAGVEQFNVEHANTPYRTTLGRTYPLPSSAKPYIYEEARYGGNDKKLEQILGLDFVGSVAAERAGTVWKDRVLAEHQRIVDRLIGEKPLFQMGSGEMKKVSLNN